MKHTSQMRGFTIVELIIVITVLGILVTIGVIGQGNIVAWSQNKTRAAELSQWKSTFDLYKSRFAVYPSPSSDGVYCMGNGFPNNKCGVSQSYTTNEILNTELSRVSQLPNTDHKVIKNIYLGPYAIYTPTTIRLVGVFQGGGSGTCPKDTTYDTASPSDVAYCFYSLSR